MFQVGKPVSGNNFYDRIAMKKELGRYLSPQALHQVKKGLVNMGYLQKINKGEYKIIDNFLEVYLLDNKNNFFKSLETKYLI